MYTLQKAKEEIDAVAKHATDIAAYTLAATEVLDTKLDGFKREIENLINAKFAELEKSLLGENHNFQTTAVEDLGAKVAQLMGARPSQAPHQPDSAGHQDHPGG